MDTIRSEKRFPLWNPYVATGISVLGDPLSAVTYPPYLLPMLAFGVPDGWWVVVWLHAFGAGVAMWMLLKKILDSRFRGNDNKDSGNDNKDSGNDKNLLALWGGLLYMGAGAFAARVAAGHIEKVLSYPWYPVFLLLLLRKSALAGAIAGVVFLTGDVYGLLFLMIFYGVVWVVGEGRAVGKAALAFLAVGAVKLVPFVRDVLPVMERFGVFDPLRGSIDVWWSWLPFVMPLGVSFYDRPLLQRLFSFWYNWYEYYAFIGLPMVFLLWLPKIIKRREVQILLLLAAVGVAFIARGSAYSPWYGLAPILTWFRTPQRMYGAMTSVVVVLIVLCAQRLKKRTVLWAMLTVTFLVSGWQMTKALKPPGRVEDTQLYRIREKVPIVDYYYGWMPKAP
ncbi:hypothetical protein HY411_03420 [Candidatus Gottesmanbacteria bacterium]|nr:hypothetical protein [Candidatus Gottesmanbacteria bacterium]